VSTDTSIPSGLRQLRGEMTAWRRELHQHPEIAFEERWTSDFVAANLRASGLEVHRGLAGTGVVGTLPGRPSSAAIALRADMDALPLDEQGTGEHRSRNAGRMHACGHDGHMAMLLGAARHLSSVRDRPRTVHFVFQPAEENEGGGRRMLEEGLFDSFPVEAVFGLHNWPGLETGSIALRPGPVMAAFDTFEAVVRGRGTHGALPHLGVDAVLAASQIVCALQTLVSRNVPPLDAAVVSVTQFHAGDAWNVLPEEARLRGTVRSFRPAVQDAIEAGIERVGRGLATALGAGYSLRYERRYPATVNDPVATERAARAAVALVGESRLARGEPPAMVSEDFAFLAQARPGAFAFLGAGAVAEGAGLHGPRYDFNDEILCLGAAYWASLALG
jgi:amidohydrolase